MIPFSMSNWHLVYHYWLLDFDLEKKLRHIVIDLIDSEKGKFTYFSIYMF